MRLKGEGKAQPSPTGSATTEATTASPAQQLDAYLRGEIAAAEAELGRLGRDPHAWQHIRVYLKGTMPSFGFGGTAEILLGPNATGKSRPVIPTRELRGFRAIESEAKRCRRCRAALVNVSPDLAGHVMVVQARKHHKKLFRQYRAELSRRSPSVVLEAPAWSAAQRAATANAALRQIDSPLPCFAAGAYLEQQRLLAWATRTLMPQAGKEARRRFMDGVARGKFPEVEQTAIRRARADLARRIQVERQRDSQPVLQAVRHEYAQLRAAGSSKAAAARAIAHDPRIRERIRAVAARAGTRPWRQEFYSFSGIRRIIDRT